MRNLFFIYFIFLSSINTILAQEKWIEHVSEEESSPRLIPIDDETFFLFSQNSNLGKAYIYKYDIYGEQLWKKTLTINTVRSVVSNSNELVISGARFDPSDSETEIHTVVQKLDLEAEVIWEHIFDYYYFYDKVLQINNEYWVFTPIEDLWETDEDWLYIHRLDTDGNLIEIEEGLPIHRNAVVFSIENNSRVLCRNFDPESNQWSLIVIDESISIVEENIEEGAVAITGILEMDNLFFLRGSANADYPEHIVLRNFSYDLEENWTNTIEEYGISGVGSYRFDKITPAHGGGYLMVGSVSDIIGKYPFMLKTDENGFQEWFKYYPGVIPERTRGVISTVDGGYISVQTQLGGNYSDIWLVKSDANGNLLDTKEYIKESFNIYPNPTTDGFTINTDKNNIKNIRVFDFQGRLVKVFSYLKYYDTSELTKGLYILQIETIQGLHRSSKLIKH